MLTLGCTETVTLVRHIKRTNEDAYQCEIIEGVSWHSKQSNTATQAGQTPGVETIVRIPEEALTGTMPAADDILVRGRLSSYTGRSSISGREAFRIATVGDNRRLQGLRHVVVKSQ